VAYRRRIHFTETQRAEIRDRGESMSSIGRLFDRKSSSIHLLLARTDGPPAWRAGRSPVTGKATGSQGAHNSRIVTLVERHYHANRPHFATSPESPVCPVCFGRLSHFWPSNTVFVATLSGGFGGSVKDCQLKIWREKSTLTSSRPQGVSGEALRRGPPAPLRSGTTEALA